MTSDKKCWSTEDIRLKKDGFISCTEKIIIVKDIEVISLHGSNRSHCPDFLKLYQITKCTGLRNICNRNDVDILAIFEEYQNYCPYNVETVCIVYECITGKKLRFNFNIINCLLSMYMYFIYITE